MEVQLRIQRYNPEFSDKPYYQEYTVDVQPTDRVLDALNQVKWHQDGTLTYRRSCAHGVCGSDAMRINGRNRLACKVLIKDIGTKITCEPLLGYEIIKDLVIDMEPFFDSLPQGDAVPDQRSESAGHRAAPVARSAGHFR